MTKNEIKRALQSQLGDWIDRMCGDPNLLERWGTADLTVHLTHEGTDDATGVELHHFVAVIDETRRVEISDEALED